MNAPSRAGPLALAVDKPPVLHERAFEVKSPCLGL